MTHRHVIFGFAIALLCALGVSVSLAYRSKEEPVGLDPQLLATSTPVIPATGSGTAAILVGAGDIGACGSGDKATAKLLDQVFSTGVFGIVFTTGDQVYTADTTSEFAHCYDPTWGRYKLSLIHI